ncbi:acyl-CoA carboxylase subunit beta [Desulfotruncus alcoholivorax]|uniref:acyl-CoA carboxylase subunit beta n=1 Tax=Desulfotruncus alcoholivorax TaxID=265477 RepID=UPI000422A070|nr:carboxyl transferase domain-containing protein [Desulfotruncus alcoholivorax]
MGKWMDDHLKKLAQLRAENTAGGGQDRAAMQHALGKMTARERIALLADPCSFDEIGSTVRDTRPPFDGKNRNSPSDGVIMGLARVKGRQVLVYSMDYTVMSGSLGDQAAWKLGDLVKMAGRLRVPLIGIIDSAGERLSMKNGDVGLNGLGYLLRNYCLYSGVIPRITLLLGPCTGLLAYLPVLADFLIMNEKTSFLWLGGSIESPDAGSAAFHMTRSGQCDLLAGSDAEAIEQAKILLDYLPQNCWEEVSPAVEPTESEGEADELLEIMPDNPKFTYNIYEVIEKIVDAGSFFELKDEYAPHLVTGFARFGGRVAGIVANNPEELSGIFEPDSSDKMDRFINFLDAFDIPLVTMVDTTAFVPGDKWERMGVIRHGAKLLHSYAHLTCPKVTMVLRRSYGGGNIVMGCSGMNPDFIYGWPTMEFAPTGPETVVHAVFNKELAKAKEKGNYQQVFDFYLGILKEMFSVFQMGKHWTTYYTVHEIIDPRETRSRIIRALEATANKHEEWPEKKRSIKPA